MVSWCFDLNDFKMVYIYLIAGALIWVFYTIWLNSRLPPGPWGLPIFGYLLWLDPKNPYVTLTTLSKKYGPIYGLNLGNVYTVVLTDPKIIKSVFSKDAATGRAPLYLTHGIMNGFGLICAEGDIWREHRRFSYNCLRQFGGAKISTQRKKMECLIMEHVLDFVQYMELDKNDQEIDILPSLRHNLGSVINLIVFGKSWTRKDEVWQWLQYLQEEAPKYMGVAGPINFLPIFRFVPKYRKIMSFIKTNQRKTYNVYRELIKEQEKVLENLDTDVNDDDESNEGKNVIQCFILEKQKKAPEIAKNLYHEVQFHHLLADLFGAGLDTTLTSLRWYFMFLAKNPLIQEEIRRELDDVLQDRLPSMDDLEELPLTEASILEALRIRPVVPVGIPHGTVKDLEIEGFRVPKGTMIIPLQWALHMNTRVWKNPDEYNPKRFINEEGKVEKSEYFMPFQIGKRMCVGDELARMLLFLFASTIVKKCSFSLKDENISTWGECGITLTPPDHKFIVKQIS